MPYRTQSEVDALGLDPLLAPRLDERLQRPHMNRFDRKVADEKIQLFKMG
ncbi:hypothetical protein ACFL1S_05925 [Pseudomonadota bacterium]